MTTAFVFTLPAIESEVIDFPSPEASRTSTCGAITNRLLLVISRPVETLPGTDQL
jgi:hypothetical protein